MSVTDLYIAFRVFRMAGLALLAETVLLLEARNRSDHTVADIAALEPAKVFNLGHQPESHRDMATLSDRPGAQRVESGP